MRFAESKTKRIVLKKSDVEAFLKSRLENRLKYFKGKVLDHLIELESEEKQGLKKSLFELESISKSALPVGYVSTYRDGSQWRKVDKNKWKCVRQAKVYSTDSNGAKIALKALVKKVEKATTADELLDIVMFNLSRFQDEKGQILPIVEELKSAVDIKKVIMTPERKTAFENLTSIVNQKNFDKVKGKSREEIFAEYDNTPKPIAVIPQKYLDYLNVKNNKLWCGKAYMLDHMVNHHPQTPLELYKRIQYILEQSNEFYLDTKNNSFVLTENYGERKGRQCKNILVFAKDIETGNIVLHKTFYDSTSKIPAKYKKINLADKQQGFKPGGNGQLPIGRSENNSAPASGPVISGRPDDSSIAQPEKKSMKKAINLPNGSSNDFSSRTGSLFVDKGSSIIPVNDKDVKNTHNPYWKAVGI